MKTHPKILVLTAVLCLFGTAPLFAQPIPALDLVVDQETGQLEIFNPSFTDAVTINSYDIISQQDPGLSGDGLLDSINWLTGNLAATFVGNGWVPSAAANVDALGELNSSGGLTIAPRDRQSLGTGFTTNSATIGAAQTRAGFGEEYLDVAFRYTNDESATVFGDVVYQNEIFNNLTLTIDATSGTVQLVNESSEAVTNLEGFIINSPAGALNTAGWNGINDDITPDWIASAVDSSALSTISPRIAGTVDAANPITIAGGASFDLGAAFTSRIARDVSVTFFTTDDLEGEGFEGNVRYLAEPGDFDNDGDFDGADFLFWQRGRVSDPPSSDDLDDWQANYGEVAGGTLSAPISAVPEPTSGVMLLFASLGLGMSRNKLRA